MTTTAPARSVMAFQEATRNPIFLYEQKIRGGWATQLVFYSCAEGEQFGKENEHNIKAGRWRVFCVPASGELAARLKESEQLVVRRLLWDLLNRLADCTDMDEVNGAIHAVLDLSQAGLGEWVTLADLKAKLRDCPDFERPPLTDFATYCRLQIEQARSDAAKAREAMERAERNITIYSAYLPPPMAT